MSILLESLIADIEDGEKVAYAVGDTNPIHYKNPFKYGLTEGYHNYLSEPILPGVYLLSIAERLMRSSVNYQLPLRIRASFFSPIYGGDAIRFEKEEFESKLNIRCYKKDSLTSQFESEKLDQRCINSEPALHYNSLPIVIEKENVKLFNRVLEIDDKKVYFVFAFGGFLTNFLRGRSGSLLEQMNFTIINEIQGDTLLTYLTITENIERETKSFRKMIYTISGIVMQDDKPIAIGEGIAKNKVYR